MHSGTPPARTTNVALRQARRQLLDQGDVAAGLLDERLARSWNRSLDFGLQASGRTPGAPHASTAQLARALEQQRELVAHARPVMEFVFEQTRDSDCMVVLADSGGMLLHTLGDAEFLDRASRVALRPGATWHEQYRGTNAIGTAMAEQAPVVVHASEHYLERNSFLTCAAAPIHDPAGRLLGALDISGDHRGYHPHTLGLARSAARMIEHKLFETRHAGQLRLRFHSQMEGIGTVTECLLADLGCLVTAEPNGPSALRRLETGEAFDLLLTDIVMPGGMSGVDLAKLARARSPHLPIVLTTGYAGDRFGDGAGEADWPVLRKPFRAEQLSAVLRDALAQPA